MYSHDRRSFQLITLVALAALVAGVAGGAMWIRAASFPIPTDDKPVTLSGLTYEGVGGVDEVNSARLEITSKEDQDPVHLEWTLNGRNTTPQMRRINLRVYLLDANKKRIAMGGITAMLKPATEKQDIVVKMKVPVKKWEQAERVYVQVDFLVK